MFWKKSKDRVDVAPTMAKGASVKLPRSKQDELEDAAKKLATSLRSYADASYAAQKDPPDEELKAAHRKVEIARKVVTEGRIAYALGRCLPEHMSSWHAWVERDDFMSWVRFDASEITSVRTQEETGARRVDVTTNDFTFNGRRYRLVFRDNGMSSAPGDDSYYGEVQFYAGEIRVANFDVRKDFSKDYSEWQFSDVKGFRIGEWMKDVLDMAAQIEAARERSMNKFVNDRARSAADEIDLG